MGTFWDYRQHHHHGPPQINKKIQKTAAVFVVGGGILGRAVEWNVVQGHWHRGVHQAALLPKCFVNQLLGIPDVNPIWFPIEGQDFLSQRTCSPRSFLGLPFTCMLPSFHFALRPYLPLSQLLCCILFLCVFVSFIFVFFFLGVQNGFKSRSILIYCITVLFKLTLLFNSRCLIKLYNNWN